VAVQDQLAIYVAAGVAVFGISWYLGNKLEEIPGKIKRGVVETGQAGVDIVTDFWSGLFGDDDTSSYYVEAPYGPYDEYDDEFIDLYKTDSLVEAFALSGSSDDYGLALLEGVQEGRGWSTFWDLEVQDVKNDWNTFKGWFS